MIQQMSYIALLLTMFSLPATAQVSSENYVQTTERISDTQSLSTTQYYDGVGQPQLSVMQSQNAASANATNGQKTINYCGNIIYDGDETMVLNAVGYSLYDKSGNLSFHYYLKDHLGDNRVVMSEGGSVEQVNDYYPTGALMGSSLGGDKQRYKYNGKELDRLNGLDWYDYGARNYDGGLGVWRSLDDNSEDNPDLSGYVYVQNNPLRMIDPDGRDGKDKIVGYALGILTDIIPGTGRVRDRYQPTDADDYNHSLRQADLAMSIFGNGLEKSGGAAVVAGGVALSVGSASLVTTAGISAEVSVPAIAIGKGLVSAGAEATVWGGMMKANAARNGSQGYSSGKNSGGTQLRSKTLWKENGKDHGRLDVENPNPTKRKGQIHYQEGKNKYIYDSKKKQFINAPNRINKLLQTNKDFQKAIQRGEKYLGL